jgi:FKBP-type peptidyl-prolyl cis-trans isomerase FklB
MKLKLLWATLLTLTLAVPGIAKSAKALTTQKQKFSYTVGYQVGMDFKRKGLDLDTEAVVQAIRDAQEGKKPKLDQQQMQQAMNNYKEALAAKRKEIADTNLKLSKAFLDQNKTKKGVKVTASGLQYEVLKAGSGTKPKASDTVEVHYHGTLIDGRVFDSSVNRGQTVSFPVSGVIKGWQEALQMMKKGAKWRVAIPPDLAYGPVGSPPVIAPNMALVFEIELIDIK